MIDAAGFRAFRRRGTLLTLETKDRAGVRSQASLALAPSCRPPRRHLRTGKRPRASGWQAAHAFDTETIAPFANRLAVNAGAATVRPFSGSFTIGARLRVVLASSWTTIQSFERLI
jgi:hypothetical protein